jgi:hypothetical protein
MKRIIGIAILSLSASVLCAQDLTMVVKVTGNLKSQSTSYMTGNATRTNDSTTGYDVLIDYQKGITYVINHKARTISFTRAADLPGLAAFQKAHMPGGKGIDEMNARMNEMYGDAAIFKVESTGTETVLGHSCKKTRITSGKLVWEYSADPSLKSPVDPAVTARLTAASYGGLGAYPQMAKIMTNMLNATGNIKGVPLKTHMSGFNGDTYMEVTSINQGSIPASMFVLPAGYAMKDQIAETEKAMTARH